MTRRAIMLVTLSCALALGVPAAAGAASGDTPPAAISDCNDHGKLTAQYSPDTLRGALAEMPVDVREYTDCYDVIERQLFAQLGQTSPGSVTGSPASSSSGGLPGWLIVVIVLLALAAVTFGALAIRRRSAVVEGPEDGPAGPGGPPAEGPGAPGDAGRDASGKSADPAPSDRGPDGPGGDAGA